RLGEPRSVSDISAGEVRLRAFCRGEIHVREVCESKFCRSEVGGMEGRNGESRTAELRIGEIGLPHLSCHESGLMKQSSDSSSVEIRVAGIRILEAGRFVRI